MERGRARATIARDRRSQSRYHTYLTMAVRAPAVPRTRATPKRPSHLHSSARTAVRRAVWIVGCSLAALACGDGIPPSSGDAAPPDTRLTILGTDDALGLSYNQRVTLRVLYDNELGERLVGEPVDFSLVATGIEEDTVGSTLSAARVMTDGNGVASVDLVAGSGNSSFRVAVNARDAPTQFYFVVISDGGFAKVQITPIHQGWRATESFSGVEVRLYRPSQITCAALDIDAPPVSFSPPRSLDGFGGAVEYKNIAAGQSQVVVAWAQIGESTARSAVGCVDIAAGQLPPGLVEFAIVVNDRPLLAQNAPVRTRFSLAEVVAHARARGADRPWQLLSCPAGPGQLLLDCALDALASDGALDCLPEGDNALTQEVAARRGQPDVDGCRPPIDGAGELSLDQLVAGAIATGGLFPEGDALAALLAARVDIAAGFTLDTELSTVSESAGQSGLQLAHKLMTVTAALADGESLAVDLLASSRPVVVQGPIATSWQGPVVSLAEHGFTLRYGQVAAAAFTELGLQPLGLAERAFSLGQFLAESVTDAPRTGCEAFSGLTCANIGLPGEYPSDCLQSACEQGAQVLDQRLSSWWQLMDATGGDFRVAGTLLAIDDDGDRLVEAWLAPDSLPEPDPGPPWGAEMILADGIVVELLGELVGDGSAGP